MAEEALDNDPEQRIMTILRFRDFAYAKQRYENYDPSSKRPLPSGPMADLVKEIDFDRARESLEDSGE